MKDDDSNSSLLESEDQVWGNNRQLKPRRRWIFALALSVLLTNLTTFMFTYKSTSQTSRSVSEPPSGIAPMLRELPRNPTPTLLNSTFYDHEDSPFRKHSSLEADEAWKDLTQSHAGVFLIRKEDAERSGINPRRHAYWNSPETGLVGYPVGVEGLHQIHCLNLLRQSLYYNIEFTRNQCSSPVCGVPEEYAQIHIDHCIDLLRRRLMCTADIGIVPMVWLGKDGRTTGDMARIHTCRDYESIRLFAIKHGHSMPETGSVKPGVGDYIVDDYI